MQSLLQTLDEHFRKTHERSLALLERTSEENLFQKPRELDRTHTVFSVGEALLRTAAVVEQTIGGLTTRLWDDPFEWTLPEELSSIGKVVEYIEEVERTRVNGFTFFSADADLARTIAVPGNMTTMFDLLVDTLSRSNHFQGRAFALYQVICDGKLPRI